MTMIMFMTVIMIMTIIMAMTTNIVFDRQGLTRYGTLLLVKFRVQLTFQSDETMTKDASI